MVEYLNKKADVPGNFPLGSFNSAFSFTGSKHIDAAATKTLSLDGLFIPLAKIQLMKSRLTLRENVRKAVPRNWDPPSLARYILQIICRILKQISFKFELFLMFRLHFDSFIENFGTHVITSITIGGKDVIYVKQHHTSPLLKSEMKNYTEDLGNQRFSDTNSQTSSGQARSKDKASSPLITLTFFWLFFL